jgi:hypothetical protein
MGKFNLWIMLKQQRNGWEINKPNLYGGEWIRCHGKLTRVESRMNECKI